MQVVNLETLRVRRDELAALLAARQFLSAKVERCEQLVQRADAALSAGGFSEADVGAAGSLTRAAAAALGTDMAPAVCTWIERLGMRPDEEETVLVVVAGPLRSVPEEGAAVVASSASVRLVTDSSPRTWWPGSLPQVRHEKGDLVITDGGHEWRLGRVPEADAKRLVTLVEVLERASVDVPVSPNTASAAEANRRANLASAGSTSLSVGDPLGGAHPPQETAAAGLVAELQQLVALHAAGALTEAEFAAAKRRLLGDAGDAAR